MAMPPVLDLDALLAPISESAPSGEFLKFAGLYDEINLARKEDDGALDQGDWKRELKTADWTKVQRLSSDALQTQTKDLQIAAWLTEALVKEHGFVGARDGFLLLERLIREFWDTFFPEIDEGDLDARANILAALDQKVGRSLMDVPLTETPGAYLPLLYLDKATAEIKKDKGSDAYLTLAAERDKLFQEFVRAKGSTPKRFYQELAEVTQECHASFSKLTDTVDRLFKRDSPDMPEIRGVLEKLVESATRFLKEKELLDPTAAEEGVSEGIPGSGSSGPRMNGGGGGGFSVAGAIQGRQDALRRLSEIADYFRQTEPHSPVSFLLRRAVAWGNMTLDSWLKEVIENSDVRGDIEKLLGIKEEHVEE